MVAGGSGRRLTTTERAVWEGLRQVGSVLTRELASVLEEQFRLTPVEFELLGVLAMPNTGHLRMGDLAERIQLTPSGATRVVDRLGRRGLLDRHRFAGGDGRAYVVTITEAGRDLVARAEPAHRAAVRRVLRSCFSRADIEVLAEVLGRSTTEHVVALSPGLTAS